MMALPLFQRKLPAIVSVFCLSVLILLLLLTQDAEARTKVQEEKYNSSSTLSQVEYQKDYTSLYRGKLNDMKYAYDQFSSLGDYYEITSQFLYVPDFPFEDHFLYLYEEGHSEDSKYLLEEGNSSTLISAIKTVQISNNCTDAFAISVQKGRVFTNEDMSSLCKNAPNQTLPILVGSDYANLLQIGDLIEGLYIQKNISLEVVGILTPNSHITLYGYPLYLDRYVVMPSFLCSEPLDEADYIFQVRHYANKLSGFFPQEKATQVFRVMADLKPLQIGSFSFQTDNSPSGIYTNVIASIGISTHTLMILLILASLLLFPLLLLYLLNTNFQHIAFCYLAGICIKKLQWQTILSSAILFIPPFLLLYGCGKLAGLSVHPGFILLILLWLLLSIIIIYVKLSTNVILTYLGRSLND
ncbi:hypothetical protein [Evtepia sp.]|uniref:hypothetical protein n=1 Tax=Evtepia sp. TaxID=2773933 RepID=UPI003F1870DC